jgi:hypothetical protein
MRACGGLLGWSLALGASLSACERCRPAGEAPVPAQADQAVGPAGIAPSAHPLLWRVTPPGEGKPAYLYGTIHLPHDRILALPPEVERAIAASDALYTEVPMDPGMQLRMAPMIMLPEGKNLKQILPEELYKRLEALFASKGLPFATLARLKPWAVATQVALLDHLFEFALKQPLDVKLYLEAQAAGKQVGGLETLEEQVAVFDALSLEEQVRMLRQTLDLLDEHKQKGRDAVMELMEAYLSGDEQKLLAAVLESYDPDDPLDRKVMQRLLGDRNRLMAERIDARLKEDPGKTFFFAVGAAHMLRDDGIGRLLEARGHRLERLGAPIAE